MRIIYVRVCANASNFSKFNIVTLWTYLHWFTNSQMRPLAHSITHVSINRHNWMHFKFIYVLDKNQWINKIWDLYNKFTHTHTHAHTHTHTHTHTRTYTQTHTHTHIRIHTHTHTAHAYTHIYTHMHTHSHTYSHTRTLGKLECYNIAVWSAHSIVSFNIVFLYI